MKFTEKTLQLFGCIVLALFITACSQAPKPAAPKPADPKPGTPEAAAAGERLMRTMSDTLAQAKAFTFETSERFDVSPTGGEKKVLHFSRKVTVRRPNGLFFEIHGEGDTALDAAAYYDGRTLTLSEKPDGKWAQTTVPGTLDAMLDDVVRRFGLPVPIGDVVYSSPYDALIGSSTKGGLVGRETIDGVPCAKLDYADEFVQVTLWLPDSGPALPRRLTLVYKKSPTPLTTELTFTNWNLDAPVTDAVFAFQPPPSSASGDFGESSAALVSRLIPAASPAVPGAKPSGEPTVR
jgi:hypothetical protein